MNIMLEDTELPQGFSYPHQFKRIIELNLVDLDPWYILTDDELKNRYNGLKIRYKNREVVPFAKNAGNDDTACWDMKDLRKVYIIHDYASPGFEQKKVYDNFWDWFRAAIEDMIECEP